jgi:hypothetical protein
VLADVAVVEDCVVVLVVVVEDWELVLVEVAVVEVCVVELVVIVED